jgi:hypothetical protein
VGALLQRQLSLTGAFLPGRQFAGAFILKLFDSRAFAFFLADEVDLTVSFAFEHLFLLGGLGPRVLLLPRPFSCPLVLLGALAFIAGVAFLITAARCFTLAKSLMAIPGAAADLLRAVIKVIARIATPRGSSAGVSMSEFAGFDGVVGIVLRSNDVVEPFSD